MLYALLACIRKVNGRHIALRFVMVNLLSVILNIYGLFRQLR